MIFDYLDGQTPIDVDELDGLKIKHISTRAELNEAEQKNIEEALVWLMGKQFSKEVILNEAFIKLLHRKMFGKTWAWAGKFRVTNKNLGVDKWQISVDLKVLLEDVDFWIRNNTFSPDEIAIRFKHRLVSIHCFSNGNGRHSRLMADIVSENIFKRPVFTWGKSFSNAREEYLRAIRLADIGVFNSILHFVRS